MKVKTTIRYVCFHQSKDGGRIFEFRVSESERPDRAISVEIPVAFFEGQDRIHLQEGVGISYSKLKQFLEIGEASDSPRMLCLNASDLAQHRQVVPVLKKRRHGSALPR